ncbi:MULTISPECIES: hypothetical protein [Pseudomonas]|nr:MULTISPECIES: hypothetical protein [Pseudomonas]
MSVQVSVDWVSKCAWNPQPYVTTSNRPKTVIFLQDVRQKFFVTQKKQGRICGLVFMGLFVGMSVLSFVGGFYFLTTTACRHQAEEADQEHRTNQSGWGFHGRTLQKLINGLGAG